MFCSLVASAMHRAITYSVNWDVSQYPSGIYYYRITSSDWNAEGRFVVVK